MGRQQTLGKFFEMPKSTKAPPPQQSSLKEMWGKKPKPGPAANDAIMAEDGSNTTTARNVSKAEKGTTVIEDVLTRQVRRGKSKETTPQPDVEMSMDSDTEEQITSAAHKRKKPVSSGERLSAHLKKRRVVEIDDEDDEEASVRPTTSALLARNSIVESEVEGEDEKASSSDEDEDEEIAEIAGTAASKSALLALSKVDSLNIANLWKTGEPVPYAALSKAFSLIEGTSKRLEKTAILTSFLLLVIQKTDPNDYTSLLKTVYLCVNRLSPDYVGVELGIGEALLVKAISQSTGRSPSKIKDDLKKEGDLGLVAMASKNSQRTLARPKALTVSFVFSQLREIALSSGKASQDKKVSIITKLLAACQGSEAKYIIRSLEGKLRIGNAERSVLVSLAHAITLAEKEKTDKKWTDEKLSARLDQGTEILKSVYSELPSYDEVVPALLKYGIDNLKDRCKLTPGIPLKPMLAKPTKAIGEVLDRFENKRFTCEYKYDGERAQVHKVEEGTVSVFSRNSEDMSKKYPDLVEQLPKCIKTTTRSFVLDAEAVAIDRSTGKLMPFQELSRRKRKDVKVEDIQVRVCLFAFDLLYLNGEPLIQKTLNERRVLLREAFNEVPGEFQFAKWSDSETVEEIQVFLEQSVKDGCEGLMVKMLETDASNYEPSRRSVNWLKVKKDYLAGVGDSLDLVVVGGYYGKGKRTNVYGAYLLACYDSDSEEFQTICKIGTGFSEEALQSHYNVLKPLEISKPRGDIKIGGAKPDIWFEPKIVWEVLTADLSLSPIYTAAQGLVEERGISLRFPRFIRIRDDKSADDATGPDQIAEMYERQALAQGSGKRKKGGDDDDGFW